MRWVESMRLDFEGDLEPLVAARAIGGEAAEAAHRTAPPRGSLGGGGGQTITYARYHPDDREVVGQAATALRAAKQAGPAAELDRMVMPVSQARGAR
jgi:hypothetical protein